jgi:hypothetical protein
VSQEYTTVAGNDDPRATHAVPIGILLIGTGSQSFNVLSIDAVQFRNQEAQSDQNVSVAVSNVM